MTKFVVEVNMIVRYIMEANTKDEAENLVFNHKNRGQDLGCVEEFTASAMTKEEYDVDHDSFLIRDLDTSNDEYVVVVQSRPGWKL